MLPGLQHILVSKYLETQLLALRFQSDNQRVHVPSLHNV